MDQETLDKLMTLIKKSLTETQSIIKQLEEQNKPIAPDNAIGRLSRMEAINTKTVSEQSLNAAKLKLNKLIFAQKQLDTGDYGCCIECSDEIPVARLELIPESTHCMNCIDKSSKKT